MTFSILAALAACSGGETHTPEPKPEPAAPAPAAAEPKYKGMFGAMPSDFYKSGAPSKELVDLGRMLYFDTRLSKGNEVSCNSCHGLDTYGVDGKPVSEGIGGQKGGRNSPTVYAAAGQFVQFWDGRAADVEEQAKGPVLNPVEMGMADGDAVMKKLSKIPGYVDAFKAAFPGEEDAMTYDNLGKAIGAFERGLVTHDSKFDKYMGGQLDALSAEEIAGLDLFVSTGCTACHSGPLFGGTMYQKLGSVVPYETADTGRMQVTNNEADKFMFKVPTLVNVAKTAPYFHDGMVTTLDDAVVKMAKHQLGKDLSAADAASISLFLNTLTGELPTDYIAMPTLPEGEEKGAKAGGGGGGGGSKAKGKAKAH